MLNQKQEKYVQNLVIGMSQREAYKDAYKAKYKDESIDTKASLLFKKEMVQKRYNELIGKVNAKSEEHTIMSAIERKEWLTKVLNGEILEEQLVFSDGEAHTESIPANLTTKMKALDILNKMEGEYIDRLKLGNDDNDKPFEVNINVVK